MASKAWTAATMPDGWLRCCKHQLDEGWPTKAEVLTTRHEYPRVSVEYPFRTQRCTKKDQSLQVDFLLEFLRDLRVVRSSAFNFCVFWVNEGIDWNGRGAIY